MTKKDRQNVEVDETDETGSDTGANNEGEPNPPGGDDGQGEDDGSTINEPK